MVHHDAGPGGAGLTSSINGTPTALQEQVVEVEVNQMHPGNVQAGGTGGGGAGGSTPSGSSGAGTANTGGGGGGSGTMVQL